jgi:hypothetical protein
VIASLIVGIKSFRKSRRLEWLKTIKKY